MKNSYVTVNGEFMNQTSNAFRVKIQADKDLAIEAWIPFSLIYVFDEEVINKAELGTNVSFRLVEWKAEELGL